MGNVIMLINSRKRVKLMKIDGETLKLKPPLRVRDVVKSYPNHVVMDSESVRSLGTKSRPLDGDHILTAGAKKLYFLVELQKLPEERVPRRVRSAGIQIGAKERLESLMLSKRSASDLTFVKAPGGSEEGGVMRVKMRVPKSQLAKLMQEGAQGQDMAEKIIGMCLNKKEEESKPINAKFTTAGTTGSSDGSRSGNLVMWEPGLRSTEESACRNTARLQYMAAHASHSCDKVCRHRKRREKEIMEKSSSPIKKWKVLLGMPFSRKGSYVSNLML